MESALEFVLKGGRTKRYHTNGTIPPQSVAEHSFMVAQLVSVMYFDREDVALIIHAALDHDLAEGSVGDIASPVKRRYPGLKALLDNAEDDAWPKNWEDTCDKLSLNQKHCLKVADNMEGLLYCAEEIRRGNVDAIEIYNNYYSYIMSSELLTNREMEMLLAIERRLKCQTLTANK